MVPAPSIASHYAKEIAGDEASGAYKHADGTQAISRSRESTDLKTACKGSIHGYPEWIKGIEARF